jgi:hypothetical protein
MLAKPCCAGNVLQLDFRFVMNCITIATSRLQTEKGSIPIADIPIRRNRLYRTREDRSAHSDPFAENARPIKH